ncbi:MAG: hypothetical protein D3906_05735 [Candidatus Electrothrix sp. AUS1_2]|nr:hypothetical protein [Candidatus Electrothrix sp. AUS1_2]
MMTGKIVIAHHYLLAAAFLVFSLLTISNLHSHLVIISINIEVNLTRSYAVAKNLVKWRNE